MSNIFLNFELENINNRNKNKFYEEKYTLSSEYFNSANKRIAVFSHATALAFLLMKWCSIEIINGKGNVKYNGNTIFNDNLNYCVTFKLTFDDNNNLIDITGISL